MEQTKYDIFISYKRKSLPTANNLYYRLTTRGYSTFFDLEEMRRDNFNIQLLNYIENAKDVFVILEEGSLDGCKKEDWENEDWFCHEIAFALEKKKNIIPILLGDYKMPSVDFFPDKLKELSLKHSPDFSFSFFDAYLDKLIEKKFITAEAHVQNKAISVFKFYSNENCQVFKEGKMVCSLEGMSDEPYYLPVPRKGDYRFRCDNPYTEESIEIRKHIDAEEDQDIQINWGERRLLKREYESSTETLIKDRIHTIELGLLKFNMVRVDGNSDPNNPQHNQQDKTEDLVDDIVVSTFYLGQFPVTQNIWEFVMGYNKSGFKRKERDGKESLELKKRTQIVDRYWSTLYLVFRRMAVNLVKSKAQTPQGGVKRSWTDTLFQQYGSRRDTSHAIIDYVHLLMIETMLSLVLSKINRVELPKHETLIVETTLPLWLINIKRVELPELVTKDSIQKISEVLKKCESGLDNNRMQEYDYKKKIADSESRITKLKEDLINSPISTRDLIKVTRYDDKNDVFSVQNDDYGHFPVENISVEEARKFVSRLSIISGIPFSIPTSEEWEYASKGGQKRKDSSGSELENFDKIAWYKDNSENTTHPVGEKEYNELNLYDMYGNVSELTKLTSNDNVYARCGGDWSCESSECLNTGSIIQNSSKRIKGMGLRVVIRENVG